MKISIKILFGFLAIISLSIAQAGFTYKFQTDIFKNSRALNDIEGPLVLLVQQGISYGSIATEQIHIAVLHAQVGKFEDIKEHKMAYDAAELKLDDIFNRDSKILLNQSIRPQAEKDSIVAGLKEINRLNLLMLDLGTRGFAAIDNNDIEAAYALTVGGDYEKYQKEIQSAVKYLSAAVNGEIFEIDNNVLNKTQQIIYINLIVSILSVILMIFVLLIIRLFIEEQYKLYKSLFDSSVDAIMILKPPTWNFTFGNEATIKLFNLKDRKQLASFTPGELSPEKQPDGQLSSVKAKEMIDHAMKEGLAFFEWTHKKYEGEDFSATVLLSRIESKDGNYLQATVRDISKSKKMEQKYRILFENATDAIFIADIETRQLVDCNKSAEKLMEYSKDELLLMKADELHPKDKLKETMEGFKKQSEGKIKSVFTEVLTKNNKRIPVKINASAVEIGNKLYNQGIFTVLLNKN